MLTVYFHLLYFFLDARITKALDPPESSANLQIISPLKRNFIFEAIIANL